MCAECTTAYFEFVGVSLNLKEKNFEAEWKLTISLATTSLCEKDFFKVKSS